MPLALRYVLPVNFAVPLYCSVNCWRRFCATTVIPVWRSGQCCAAASSTCSVITSSCLCWTGHHGRKFGDVPRLSADGRRHADALHQFLTYIASRAAHASFAQAGQNHAHRFFRVLHRRGDGHPDSAVQPPDSPLSWHECAVRLRHQHQHQHLCAVLHRHHQPGFPTDLLGHFGANRFDRIRKTLKYALGTAAVFGHLCLCAESVHLYLYAVHGGDPRHRAVHHPALRHFLPACCLPWQAWIPSGLPCQLRKPSWPSMWQPG